MTPSFAGPQARFAQEFIDSAPDAIIIVDGQGKIVLANEMTGQMFGHEASEMVGEPVERLIPERFHQVHSEHRQGFFTAPRVRPMGASINLRARRNDGSEFPVEISLSPMETEAGEMVMCIVRDVSNRRLTESALEASEERFRKIFEHSNDAIYLVDPENDTIKDTNPTACRMLGYSRREMLSLDVSDIHPDEMPQLRAFANMVFMNGGGWTNELTCRTKGGTFLPAEISASVVEIDGQDYMIAMVRDTTERKIAEKRIQQGAARVDSLARIAARLNVHLTLEGVLKAVCEETVKALEVPAAAVLLFDAEAGTLAPAAVLGLPGDYTREYMPLERSIYDRYVEQQGSTFEILDLQQEDGLPNQRLFQRVGARTVIVASMLREGELTGTLNVYSLHQVRSFSNDEKALLQGLADQAALAIENARLRDQAQRGAIVEERTRLARDLHDSVAQALYGVTLSAEAGARMLSSNELDSAGRQLLKIRTAAEEALREMRLLIYELRPPDLASLGLVAALQARLENVERRSGVKADFKVEGNPQIDQETEEALYRIVREALNNALKHAQATTVSVTLKDEQGMILLDVEDDGVGFDPKSTGGLGLNGMRERVERLRGDFSVHSNGGVGTRVHVVLRAVSGPNGGGLE
ncbi:MAG: PAS domain S-box protein [Anaerolineales bacterium]